MAKTEAKVAFEKNIRRPKALLEMFEAGSLKPKPGEKRTVGKPSWQENELLRASVIVSIGALDAYLSDVAAEVLVAQLDGDTMTPEEGRRVLQRVQKEIPTLALELALNTNPQDRADVAREAIRDHLTHRTSNHGPGAVSTAVERMGGKFNWDDLDVVVPEELETKTVVGAAAVLEDWTKRRHRLVHEGVALKVTLPKAKALSALSPL